MRIRFSRRRTGFTLIEIIVVIAILVTLVAIAAPFIYSRLSSADVEACRNNLQQIFHLGQKYSGDMAHRHLLPTSGMDDDEDTKYVNESIGWWYSVAPELESTVLPARKGAKMKISSIFHCKGDTRASIKDDMMTADIKNVSYVSWTDGSEDRKNPNSCIRTTARQNLDTLPWLSDGVPVKNKSVTDLASFKKMVMPAAERHGDKLIVLYASGTIKYFDIKEDTKPAALFAKIAPDLAKGKKGTDEEDASDEEGDEPEPTGESEETIAASDDEE